MTAKQARTLQAGQQVVWTDGTLGRVIEMHYTVIVIRFEGDGDNSYLHPFDCDAIELVADIQEGR